MIYLFGVGEQVSVIFDGRHLSPENKAKATLVVEALPEPQQIAGKFAVRYINPETKKFSYIYKDIPKE